MGLLLTVPTEGSSTTYSITPAYVQGRVKSAYTSDFYSADYCIESTRNCGHIPYLTVTNNNRVGASQVARWGVNGFGPYYVFDGVMVPNRRIKVEASVPLDSGWRIMMWSWGSGNGDFTNIVNPNIYKESTYNCPGTNKCVADLTTGLREHDNNVYFYVEPTFVQGRVVVTNVEGKPFVVGNEKCEGDRCLALPGFEVLSFDSGIGLEGKRTAIWSYTHSDDADLPFYILGAGYDPRDPVRVTARVPAGYKLMTWKMGISNDGRYDRGSCEGATVACTINFSHLQWGRNDLWFYIEKM